jgi:hypothetical protein
VRPGQRRGDRQPEEEDEDEERGPAHGPNVAGARPGREMRHRAAPRQGPARRQSAP